MLDLDNDLEDPTPSLNQIFWGCIQTRAEAVQAKADLFQRITASEVTSEKQNISDKSSQPVTAWSLILPTC